MALWLLALTAVGACDASPQLPALPDNTVSIESFIEGPRTIGPREGTYRGGDSAELGFLGYLADGSAGDLALVYLHGIESHAAWFDGPARLLQAQGLDLFALDRRGSGINRENRHLPSGHAASMEVLLADVEAFVEPLSAHYRTVVLIGLSWGGKLATAFELSRPGTAMGLILITPGIRALVDVSTGTKLRIFAASLVAPETRFATPIEPEMFTTTPEHLAYIENDPLRLSHATARFFMTSHKLDGFIDDNVVKLDAPVLLFLAGRDRIIDNEGVVDVLHQAQGSSLTVITYPEQTHSIQFDAPEMMVEDIRRWLDEIRPAMEGATS